MSFDNLVVQHYTGPLLEETHYYSFGLTMAGICSKAAGELENMYKFVGQELDDDLGLNWYQFKWRNNDPQIGRFLQIDPLADNYVYNSTYTYAENRVINGIDLEGLEFYQTTNVQPDGTKSIINTIKVKVVNNTEKMTTAQVKQRMEAAKTLTHSILSGKDADGNSVNTTLQYKMVKEIDPSKDFYVSFVDETQAGTELGYTIGDIGNTTVNGFEISSDQTVGAFFDTKDVKGIVTETVVHELGHGGGLRHSDDKKNPEEVKKTMTPLNFMDKTAVGTSVATPAQLSEINKHIPENQKKTVNVPAKHN